MCVSLCLHVCVYVVAELPEVSPTIEKSLSAATEFNVYRAEWMALGGWVMNL